MTTIDFGIRRHDFDRFLRRSTRLTAVAAYTTAVVIGLMAARPAFHHEAKISTAAQRPSPAQTDVLLKGESVATFAARHGLDLGELLALNPRVNSLSLPAGTRLRTG
jgi:LysM domain-containing protein